MTPSPITGDRPTLALSEIGRYGRDVALIGMKHGNHHAVWDRRHTAFLLAGGEQGSGKSVLLRALHCHDLKVGNQPIILEVKRGETAWLKGKATRVLTPQGWLRALRWGVAQMEARQDVCEAHEVPSIADVDPDTPWISFYLDEAPAIWGEEAERTLGQDGRKEAITLTEELAKRGRSARVGMVASTQDPTLDSTFGGHKAGGGIRLNFNCRVLFDPDEISIRAMFGRRITDQTERYLMSPHKGRCAALGLHPDDGGRAAPVQIWHITHDMARPFAANYQGPPPIDFDAGPRVTEYPPS